MINKTKYWVAVSLPVTNQAEDSVANFLFELGAQGCYSQEGILRAYFMHSDWNMQKYDQFKQYLIQLIELNFQIQLEKLQVQKFKDQDWNVLWKQSFEPIKISDKILIKPSWVDIKPPPSTKVIEIDPQLAFGTGMHATTQLMLKLYIEHLGSPMRIVDIGTGTGILAIAAAKLSNAQILAFDNDLIATATAQQNFIKNKVSDRIQIFCGTIDAVKNIQFDLILANINRSTIVAYHSKIYRCLKNSGIAIFSGILVEEKSNLFDNLSKYHFKILDEQIQGEWVGLVVQKGDW